MNHAAILDLKGAYDRVPRDKLIQLLQMKLPQHLASQVIAFIGPLQAKCVEDEGTFSSPITRGVPQGSPLSPSVYNLFMDTFDEMLRQASSSERDALLLFADDVQLRSESPEGLQMLLEKAKTWAKQFDMTWSTSKCKIISNCAEYRTFRLANTQLQHAKEAEYLVVSISSEGITPTKLFQRIRTAIRRLS